MELEEAQRSLKAINPAFNDEIASQIKQNQDLTDTKKKVLVSYIPIHFETLREDMEAVFRITKGIGNIFLKVSVDLGKRVAEIEFCGITQQKDAAMTSTGKGVLREANQRSDSWNDFSDET